MVEVLFSRSAERDLLAGAGFGRLLLARDGRVLFADHVACALLGFADLDALRREETETRPLIEDWLEQVSDPVRIAAGPLPRRLQCKIRKSDGQLLHALISMTGLENGKFEAVLVPCPELQATRAALQYAEKRYRELLELSHNGVFITAGENLLFVNSAFAEMLAARPEDLLKTPCLTHIHEDDRPFVADVMRSFLDDDAAYCEFAVRLWMKNRMGTRDVSVRVCRASYAGTEGILGVVYDVTDLRRGETVMRDYAKRLRILSQQIIDIQENERKHLARELHDEIGQQLTLLKMSLERLRRGERDEQLLDNALTTVSTLMQDVRNLSLDLRPTMLDDLGLAATLRWYASRAAAVSGLKVSLDIDPRFPRLRPETETLYFRVAQEAITNALRHSGASLLQIVLSAGDQEIALHVSDNGCGFDPDQATEGALKGGSAGLLGIQERAALGGAVLEFESAPGKGTWLRLVLRR